MRINRILLPVIAGLVVLTCHAKEPVMSDTKTWCVGRFLVDIPADAQVNGQEYEYIFGPIASDTSATSEQHFTEMMAQRETELKAGKQKDSYTLTSVKSPSSSIRIFELSKQLVIGPSAGFEAYRWNHDHVFSMQERSYQPEKLPQTIVDLNENVLSKLEFRAEDEEPPQPGFCLKDGFIANDGANAQYEDAGISFKFARWPGVLVSVSTETVTKMGEQTLLQRMDSGGVPAQFIHLFRQIKTLRRGHREINGRKGEEILETVPADGGFHLHQFRWEAQGTSVSEPLKPTLVVELESGVFSINGEPMRPQLTDAQAIAVFDAVAASIRLRPTSGDKTNESEPIPNHPLGTLAQTGTPCPQTGWWTCPEASGNELAGGQRQHFAAGAMLPVAYVLGKPSLVDKLLGKQPQHAVNTMWQLVAYDKPLATNTPTAVPPDSTSLAAPN